MVVDVATRSADKQAIPSTLTSAVAHTSNDRSFWTVFVMFFVLIAVVTPYGFQALCRLEHDDLLAQR